MERVGALIGFLLWFEDSFDDFDRYVTRDYVWEGWYVMSLYKPADIDIADDEFEWSFEVSDSCLCISFMDDEFDDIFIEVYFILQLELC